MFSILRKSIAPYLRASLRKAGLLITLFSLPVLLVFCTTVPRKAENVVVDLGRAIGPATGRASGFLHSMSAIEPVADLVEALNPRLFRMWAPDFAGDGSGAWAVYARVQAMGARMQIVMSDSQGYEAAGWWPGDADSMPKWDAIVTGLLARARADTMSVEWDVWNEPNISSFWARSQAQFFETWRHTVRVIRKLSPTARIVGPSLSGFDKVWLESFLRYANANDVLPDTISWHEFGNPTDIPAHLTHIRSFLISLGVGARPIELNEIMDARESLLPGTAVQYFANLERAKVDGACHACWDIGGVNTCANRSLDGILTVPERRPRAVWWAYKAYSELTGIIVDARPSATIDGLASRDIKQQSLKILLGRDGLGPDLLAVSVGVRHTASLFPEGAEIRVLVQLIPASGLDPLPSPITIARSVQRLAGNEMTVDIPGFGAHDACLITMEPAGTTSQP